MAEYSRHLHETVRKVDDCTSGILDSADIALLRDLIVFAVKEPAFDAYLRKTALELAFDSIRHPEKVISPTSTRFREALQYTLAHRDRVGPGEVVIGARVRKQLQGDSADTGHSYLELRVLAADGSIREDEVSPTVGTEVLVVHFERPSRVRITAWIHHAVRMGLRGNLLAQHSAFAIPSPARCLQRGRFRNLADLRAPSRAPMRWIMLFIRWRCSSYSSSTGLGSSPTNMSSLKQPTSTAG